jgi:hypothetical protein
MARAIGADLERYLKNTATDDQSDGAIANKILRKFGLVVARSTYRKVGRRRMWSYTVSAPMLWRDLSEARAMALRGVTDLLEDSFNKSVTPPPGNIPPDDWRELVGMANWAKQQGAAALADFRNTISAQFTPDVWAALAA